MFKKIIFKYPNSALQKIILTVTNMCIYYTYIIHFYKSKKSYKVRKYRGTILQAINC